MFGDRLRTIALLLLLGMATTAAARADGPGADFKPDTEATATSPDQQIRIEPYFKDRGDDGLLYQFWTFDNNHQHGFLLNPGEGDDVAGYAAGFRFSPDSQWLVRMQKLGAGYHTLYLYRRDGLKFSPATKKPLGELAWDYFLNQPTARRMHRKPKDRDSLDHLQANLLKGMEENYAWLGQHWPDSRYVVITLSFDSQGEKPKRPWIEGWRCVYDMKTATFSVPADFAEHNAKAVKTPGAE
jgi:hypothetical protein